MDENREYPTTIEQRIKIMELAVDLMKSTTSEKGSTLATKQKELIAIYTTMYDLINPRTNQSNE